MAPKKRQSCAITLTVADELLEVIQTKGTLDHDQLLLQLKAGQPPCDPWKPCKANNKQNPNCLCQLIPAEGSTRKKGVWQKDKAYLSALGPDPAGTLRSVSASIRGRPASTRPHTSLC
jgi:hypothetical protein